MAFTRAAVEHHAYNTNAEFANFRPHRRALPRAGLNVEAGSALPSAVALSICACRGDISLRCYRGRRDHQCDSPARRKFSFAKVERCRSLNQVSRLNLEM